MNARRRRPAGLAAVPARRPLRRAWCFALALALASPAHAAAPLAGASEPATIARARELFAYAHFTSVVELLQPALETDSIEVSAKVTGFELVGRSHVRLGEIEEGVRAFTRLLDLSPAHELDARRVADDESAVFSRARRQWLEAHPGYVAAATGGGRREVFYRQRRFQLVGAAAVAGLAALFLQRRQADSSNELLPALPGHP